MWLCDSFGCWCSAGFWQYLTFYWLLLFELFLGFYLKPRSRQITEHNMFIATIFSDEAAKVKVACKACYKTMMLGNEHDYVGLDMDSGYLNYFCTCSLWCLVLSLNLLDIFQLVCILNWSRIPTVPSVAHGMMWFFFSVARNRMLILKRDCSGSPVKIKSLIICPDLLYLLLGSAEANLCTKPCVPNNIS